MKTRNLNKILSVALSVTMASSMMPAPVLAQEKSKEVIVDEKEKVKAVDVNINEKNFPDPEFRAFVEKLPGAEDGLLTAEEIIKIKEIDCSEKKIKDFTGIEYFVSLEKLSLGENEATSLDVSKNTELEKLNCDGNKLTELDVTHNLKLKTLNCSFNKLTSLDLSKNKDLECLYVSENPIKELDITHNKKLTTLYLGLSVKNLDLSQNTALKSLELFNCNLSTLDLSQNTALEELVFDFVRLPALDLSKNTNLKKCKIIHSYFYAEDGTSIDQIPGFDVSKVSIVIDGNFDNGIVTYTNQEDKSFAIMKYIYDLGNEYSMEVDLRDESYQILKDYTVKHMQEQLDGTYVQADVETLSGKAGELTTATAKEYAGFHALEVKQDKISSDGKTVVEVKYERNRTYMEFDANGGTGEMKPLEFIYGETDKFLPANTFTYEGYEFTGWNTDPSGSGIALKDKELIAAIDENTTHGKTVRLFAQWKKKEAKPEVKPEQPENKPEQPEQKPETKPETKPEQKPGANTGLMTGTSAWLSLAGMSAALGSILTIKKRKNK